MRNQLTRCPKSSVPGVEYGATGQLDGQPADVIAFKDGALLLGFGSLLSLRLTPESATEMARCLTEAVAVLKGGEL